MDINNELTLKCILIFISIFCFYNGLDNDLVHDDIKAIVNNKDVTGPSKLLDLFSNDFWGREMSSYKSHKSYRPLCVLSFRLNHYMHGLEAYGYHIINVFLHVCVVLLYHNILKTMIFHDNVFSFLASLMFAVHPVHVEAVTGIVGRADVMSCLFFLIAFQTYCRYLDKIISDEKCGIIKRELIQCLILGATCLLIKENSFSIFGVFIVIDVLVNSDLFLRLFEPIEYEEERNRKISRIHSLTKRVAIVNIVGITLLYFRLKMNDMKEPMFIYEDNPASFSKHFSTRVMTYSYLFVFNLKLLLAPIVLSYDWQGASIPLVENISDARNMETACFFIISISFVVFVVREMFKGRYEENKALLFGLVLLVIPFIPASNMFLTVGFVVAERILYIPSLGFCIIVLHGFKKLNEFTEKKKVLHCMFLISIGLLSVRTVMYNKVWRSRESLFRHGVATVPHNVKAHYNYANYLSDNNFTNHAIHHYKIAVNLDGKHSSSHNNLGLLLSNLTEAKQHFLEAIKYTPGHYRAMLNLASVYRKEGNFHAAEEYLVKCLKLSPGYYDAQLLLADTLHMNKKDSEAHRVYKSLLEMKSNDINLMMNYGQFLMDIGYLYDAMNVNTQLLKLRPRDHRVLLNTAKIYEHTKQYDQAINYYERAINVRPNDPTVYQALMKFHFDSEQFSKAKHVSERLLKKCRPTVEHIKNHAVVLYKSGDRDNAVNFIRANMKNYENHSADLHHVYISFLEDLQRLDERLEAAKRAVDLFPNDVRLFLQYGNVELAMKNYDRALEIFKKVLSRKNDHYFNALHAIGNIYHFLKNFEEARKYYELASKIDPSNQMLRRNIEKLKRIKK